MTNIVFENSYGREIEIDPANRRLRVQSFVGDPYVCSYEATDRPIGLGHVQFLNVTGDIWNGWPEVHQDLVEFVELRDDEGPAPYTAAEWQRAHVLVPVPDVGGVKAYGRLDTVPDVAGRDLWFTPSAAQVQALLDAVEAAPDPKIADFKISEAAEEIHEILERRAAGPVHDAEYLEELIYDFFEQHDPKHVVEDIGVSWVDTPDDPDLILTVDENGSVNVCVVVTTIDPSDFTDQI